MERGGRAGLSGTCSFYIRAAASYVAKTLETTTSPSPGIASLFCHIRDLGRPGRQVDPLIIGEELMWP